MTSTIDAKRNAFNSSEYVQLNLEQFGCYKLWYQTQIHLKMQWFLIHMFLFPLCKPQVPRNNNLSNFIHINKIWNRQKQFRKKIGIVTVIMSWHIFNSLVRQATPLSLQEAWLLIINHPTYVQNRHSSITSQQVITAIGVHFTAKMTGKI